VVNRPLTAASPSAPARERKNADSPAKLPAGGRAADPGQEILTKMPQI